jgi:(1->4)-alpha-D-glucan 1-alpha-D-glucosylmutase
MTLLQELATARQERDAATLASELIERQGDALKLFVTTTLLHMRRDHTDLFRSGGYQGLTIEGTRPDHLFAFERRDEEDAVIVVVPRLISSLIREGETVPTGERIWGDTHVRLPRAPARALRDRFTGRCIEVHADARGEFLRAADLFELFPLACLEAR